MGEKSFMQKRSRNITIGKRFIASLVFATLFVNLQGCASQPDIPAVQSGLPAEKLAYFSDSFDELRSELWDPTGMVYEAEQLRNYQSADMRIENGWLVIRTHAGSFSKGGLESTFKLRGNYDLQIDCQFDFLGNAGAMDQVLAVAALQEGPSGNRVDTMVTISLVKSAGDQAGMLTAYRKGLHILEQSWHQLGDFNGSFRIVRVGGSISTFYRKAEGRWQRTGVFPSGSGDTRLGLILQNFVKGRKSIHADKPVVGRFDNFKVNAAQEIIESEI